MINNETFKAVGIIGKPIKQSLSPYLHNYWINKYSLSSYYLPLPVSNINHIKLSLKKLNFFQYIKIEKERQKNTLCVQQFLLYHLFLLKDLKLENEMMILL